MRGNILVTVTLCSSWAGLRQTAHTTLPLLESREETQLYAAWLAAQMDYLDVTDEIRITIPAPKVETNRPPPPMANPPSQTEREIWVEKDFRPPWSSVVKEYVAQLKPTFATQEIPPELVWMPEVESSFEQSEPAVSAAPPPPARRSPPNPRPSACFRSPGTSPAALRHADQFCQATIRKCGQDNFESRARICAIRPGIFPFGV